MSSRREIRELALQTLYQLDARGEGDREQIDQSVQEAPFTPQVREQAAELAEQAWRHREAADQLIGELAPDWPTHRQPLVDRNLLRLGYYELVSRRSPVAVAINEAVEIAKRYGSDRSPAFINGVLDRIDKRLREQARSEPQPPDAAAEKPSTGDDWLDDALQDRRPEQ